MNLLFIYNSKNILGENQAPNFGDLKENTNQNLAETNNNTETVLMHPKCYKILLKQEIEDD